LIHNEKFESLIGRLEKVKRSGRNVRAVCPVHGSKGQTLSVTEKDGGYIVAHCFSCGAGGPEVVKALGLPVGLLFPEDDYTPPTVTTQMKEASKIDAFILQEAHRAKTLKETRIVTKARERAKGYELKAEQAEEYAPPIEHPALDDFRQDYARALEVSPALRSEIVDSHWEGVATRSVIKERAIKTAEGKKPTAEAWLLAIDF